MLKTTVVNYAMRLQPTSKRCSH